MTWIDRMKERKREKKRPRRRLFTTGVVQMKKEWKCKIWTPHLQTIGASQGHRANTPPLKDLQLQLLEYAAVADDVGPWLIDISQPRKPENRQRRREVKRAHRRKDLTKSEQRTAKGGDQRRQRLARRSDEAKTRRKKLVRRKSTHWIQRSKTLRRDSEKSDRRRRRMKMFWQWYKQQYPCEFFD